MWTAIIIVLVLLGIGLWIGAMYRHDRKQSQHSILRNFPVLGRLRYLAEHLGPEARQYLIHGDKDGKPMDRDTQSLIAKAGKNGSTVIGFGSTVDFSKQLLLLNNSPFPKNAEELHVDNEEKVTTFQYKIVHDGVFERKEVWQKVESEPWYLRADDALIIGPNSPNPFTVKGLIGVSAMSYGALSKSAVQAICQGVAISGGSWMVTGEGGLSPYHLSKMYQITAKVPPSGSILQTKIYEFVRDRGYTSNFEIVAKFDRDPVGDIYIANRAVMKVVESMVDFGYLTKRETDVIFQIGSGLFGARDHDGHFSKEIFLKNASASEVKAIEIKMAQGAKTKGGHLEAGKNTAEVALIRGIEAHTTIDSPNRFSTFDDVPSLMEFIRTLKELSGKPVGIKVVLGNQDSLVEIAQYMRDYGFGPDYITVDGGEGGTGATYQEMADSVGLPIYSAIVIADDTLRQYGVRDRVKLIASGMLATPDKIAIALGLGADLVQIARGIMNTVGCINSMRCHTNECPTGVTSHNPKLEQGLVVVEKRFRTANYLTTLRHSLYNLAAACGLDTPTKFTRRHVTYKGSDYKTIRADLLYPARESLSTASMQPLDRLHI